jgi:hypothetical protein
VIHNKNKYEPIESETLAEFITKSEHLTQPTHKDLDDTPRQFEKDGYFGELLDEAVIGST